MTSHFLNTQQAYHKVLEIFKSLIFPYGMWHLAIAFQSFSSQILSARQDFASFILLQVYNSLLIFFPWNYFSRLITDSEIREN